MPPRRSRAAPFSTRHGGWRRVTARNEQQGETYRVTVTRPMFDFIETIWQEPDAAELAALDGVRVG